MYNISSRVNIYKFQKMKKTIHSNSNSESAKADCQVSTSKRRGRPKKIKSAAEIAQSEKAKKNKLTLAEKQAIKLKQQKERQAKKIANGELEPKNKERFYCTNKELQAELIKWRDSAEAVEDRIISEELGKMLIAISQKILNHSNFRNYSPELKADMQGFFYYKAIKGLKNYNFEFNNPFAWFTQCAFNSYLTIITRHYKHLNIKKDLMKKLLSELETYSGIDPRSSLNKCIKTYISDDESLLES